MKPIRKGSVWVPYAKISQKFFTDPVLSTSELAVGCLGISRNDRETGRALPTSAMTVSLTLGFNRSYVYDLFRGVCNSAWISKTETSKAHKFVDVGGDSSARILVPKVIMYHEYLTAQEKIVLICLFNDTTLKLRTMKAWAGASRLHPRTLTKVIAKLKEMNVLKTFPNRKLPVLNEPNSWKVLRPLSNKEIYGPEWEKFGYAIKGKKHATTTIDEPLNAPDTEDGFLQWSVS